VDQKSLDIGDECYWAALKRYAFPPFILSLFHCVRIYPSPELSSKNSASVVCCSSMRALFYFAVSSQVRMACGNVHLSPFDSRELSMC
jgi:hypothetical protein